MIRSTRSVLKSPEREMGRSFLIFFCAFLTCVNCQSCFNVQFVCGDGECLNRNNDDNGVCDSKVDCSDGSDESRCGSGPGIGSCTFRQYRCLNEQCISGGSVCDGNNDCGDNSDERSCGNLNLVGLIVGVTVGVVVLSLCCPLCIILGILACVFYVFRRQKRIDRDLRSKNIPVTTGNLLGGTQQQVPPQPAPSVQYTKQEEKVDLLNQQLDS